MSIEDDFSKVDSLLEDNMMNYLGHPAPRIIESQPKNASWVSVDVELGSHSNTCLEQSNVIGYRNAKEMAYEVQEFVKAVFTPELVQMVRDGTIKNLSFRIGPTSIGSSDLNFGTGIDKQVFDKSAKKA